MSRSKIARKVMLNWVKTGGTLEPPPEVVKRIEGFIIPTFAEHVWSMAEEAEEKETTESRRESMRELIEAASQYASRPVRHDSEEAEEIKVSMDGWPYTSDIVESSREIYEEALEKLEDLKSEEVRAGSTVHVPVGLNGGFFEWSHFKVIDEGDHIRVKAIENIALGGPDSMRDTYFESKEGETYESMEKVEATIEEKIDQAIEDFQEERNRIGRDSWFEKNLADLNASKITAFIDFSGREDTSWISSQRKMIIESPIPDKKWTVVSMYSVSRFEKDVRKMQQKIKHESIHFAQFAKEVLI